MKYPFNRETLSMSELWWHVHASFDYHHPPHHAYVVLSVMFNILKRVKKTNGDKEKKAFTINTKSEELILMLF